MKRLVVLLLFFLSTVRPVFAATYPSPTGFVNDFAKILTADQKNTLEQNLINYEKQTGNEVTVAIFPDLGGDTIENFTIRLEEQWKVGKKGKDNGVLLVIAMQERKIRIEVGYGLEPLLTDAKAGDIIRNQISPQFKTGNYYQGISDGISAIEQTIGGPSQKLKSQIYIDPNTVFFIIFLIILLISIFFRNKKRRRGPWDFLFGWFLGSNFGSGSNSGGFGGFGGGSSGGGGASGDW